MFLYRFVRYSLKNTNVISRYHCVLLTSNRNERRGGLASLSIALNSSWTNSLFEAELCSKIASIIVTSVTFTSTDPATPRLKLPDCFFNNISALNSLTSTAPILISGSGVSGEQSDPLLRLSSRLIFLNLDGASFVNPVTNNGADGGTYTADLNAFLANKRSLQDLSIQNTNLGGSLPASVGNGMYSVVLANNKLSGSIPPTIFNATTGGDVSDLMYNFSGNALTGTISSNLFSWTSEYLSYLWVDFSNNALTGTLPPALIANSPANSNVYSYTFGFNGNLLSGSVPANLFNFTCWGLTTMTLNLQDNAFTGTVSSTLFSTFKSQTGGFAQLTLNLGGNLLTGSVPYFFDNLAQFPSLATTLFNFSNNRLSGALPASLMPNSTYTKSKSISWHLDSNAISGTIPPTLLTRATAVTSVVVSLSRNSLTGSVPTTLFQNLGLSSSSTALTLNLAGNSLSGALINSVPAGLPGVSQLTLDLSSNAFGGTVPDAFLTALAAGRKRNFNVNLSNCAFTGSLPQSNLGAASKTSIYINFDSNKITGSYPWNTLVSNLTSVGPTVFSLSAPKNQLAGSISLPTTGDSSYWLYLSLPYNSFSSLSVSAPAKYLRSLDVSENPTLNGTIPVSLFATGSTLQVFKANHTALSGTFPDIGASATTVLDTLDLSYTDVNFCGTRSAWSSAALTSCNLKSTNATNCKSSYPSSCRYDDSGATNPDGTPSSTPSTPASGPAVSSPSSTVTPASPSTASSPSFPISPSSPESPASESPAPGSPATSLQFGASILLALALTLALTL